MDSTDARALEEMATTLEMPPLPIGQDHVEGDLFDDVLPSRADSHLARVREGLQLYINAKFLQHVKFNTLGPELAEIGISARSVNGSGLRGGARGIGRHVGPPGGDDRQGD